MVAPAGYSARLMLAGMLLGLGASACWALANVVVQRAGRAVGALRGLLWAQVIGVALSALGAIAFDDRSAPFSTATAGWVAVAGVSALLAYFCLFYAFEHGRLTVAVPIMSSWAVIAAGLSLAIFREPVRPLQRQHDRECRKAQAGKAERQRQHRTIEVMPDQPAEHGAHAGRSKADER